MNHKDQSGYGQNYAGNYKNYQRYKNFVGQNNSTQLPKISGMLEAMEGAIAAGFIGDSCGGVLEFNEVNDSLAHSAMNMSGGGKWKLKPGQVTDDSEMAMCLAASLAAVRVHYGEMDALVYGWHCARNYNKWYKSYPFDIGDTTKNAVMVEPDPVDYNSVVRVYKNTHELNSSSLSNGALMRSVPLALWLSGYLRNNINDKNAIENLICPIILDTAITHCRHEAQISSCIYVVMLTYLIVLWDEKDIDAKISKTKKAVENCFTVLKKFYDRKKVKIVRDWYDDAITPDHKFDPQDKIGFLKHGFCMAFNALVYAKSFEDTLYTVIFQGGDTDTNAAIAMPVVGAKFGIKVIPKRFIKILDEARYSRGKNEFNSCWYKSIAQLLYSLCATESLLTSAKNKLCYIQGMEYLSEAISGSNKKMESCQDHQLVRLRTFVKSCGELKNQNENKENRQ